MEIKDIGSLFIEWYDGEMLFFDEADILLHSNELLEACLAEKLGY